MDQIFDSENGTVSSTDLLNCADRLQTKKMKKKETEHVLNKFVQDKWLNEVHFMTRLQCWGINSVESVRTFVQQQLGQ